jgi:hypothetical protein
MLALLLPAVAVHAEVLEGYAKPFTDGTPCCYTHWFFDACSGVWIFLCVWPGVVLDSDPCEAVTVVGFWGTDVEGCVVFHVQDVGPPTGDCQADPRIRVEPESDTFLFTWDFPPCVELWDVIGAQTLDGNATGMEAFACVLNDLTYPAFTLGGGEPPGLLWELLVRGQQGPLASDHYGLSSSGEPRVLESGDCSTARSSQPTSAPGSIAEPTDSTARAVLP